MRVYLKYSFLIFIGSLCNFCSGPNSETVTVETIKDHKQIEKIGWLIGEWGNNAPEGNLVEVWETKNDSALWGRSFFINTHKDTLSSETVSLEQRGNNLYYIPTVKDQNQGKPVRFTLTNSSDNKFVFENPEHDFPTKITYTKITRDSLLAEISGIQNGKERIEQFPMSRTK